MMYISKMLKNIKDMILGIVIGGTIIGGGVIATTVSSSSVTYSNSTSKLSSTNVQGAVDALYTKAKSKDYNSNIIKAYTYSETGRETGSANTYSATGNNKCINGEEKTCVETTCYKKKTANSCIQGTIIKYYVNDTEQKVFYVLHDDGSTITMQQRESTVRNIPWYKDTDDNTKGPLTILPSLEAATATWTNVEYQEYTAGYTNFYQNAYTGCSAMDYKITCSENIYNGNQANLTLSKRKVRARMITAQEASSTGCLVLQNGSCPDWMHNYLYKSKTYGGSYEDNTHSADGNYSFAYWTMSSAYRASSYAWVVARDGNLYNHRTSYTNDARAVVVISK